MRGLDARCPAAAVRRQTSRYERKKTKCHDDECLGNNGAMRGDLIGRSEGGSPMQNYVTAVSD
jgi:hypothetical protein